MSGIIKSGGKQKGVASLSSFHMIFFPGVAFNNARKTTKQEEAGGVADALGFLRSPPREGPRGSLSVPSGTNSVDGNRTPQPRRRGAEDAGGLPGPCRPRNRTRRHRAEAEEAFGNGQLSGVRGFGGPSSAPIRSQPGTQCCGAGITRGRAAPSGVPTPASRRCFPGVSPLRAASVFPLRLRGTGESSELSGRICSTPLAARHRSQCP